jgi:hypothetical protein
MAGAMVAVCVDEKVEDEAVFVVDEIELELKVEATQSSKLRDYLRLCVREGSVKKFLEAGCLRMKRSTKFVTGTFWKLLRSSTH